VHGPNGYLSTVEHLTRVRMNHIAIVDWNGFRAITDALGGVRVFIPVAMDDRAQGSFEQGWQTLDGEQALRYVRTRYSLPNGDFDRIQRQQNFLRAMMGQVVDEGASANVVKLTDVVEAITSNLTLDSEWTTGDIRSLALSLRGLRPDDISFLTAPIAAKPFRDVPGEGSVVLLDTKGLKNLFAAMSHDDMATYVESHADALLPDSRSVN
jgi:anionic cell wall polymer biosynthesis LytR-Cps2A-Psr (LCP) family protein